MRPLLKTVLKALTLMVGLGTITLVLLSGALWLERNSSIELPRPTGAFAVGRSIQHWVDDATLDPLAPVLGTKRELLVWIWYPSPPGQLIVADDYVPTSMRTAAGPATGPFRFVTRDLSRVKGHSAHDSALASTPAPYPVVIMRAGASAGVVGYSTLAEDLASHGYIVVGFDAPYRTGFVSFPDGRSMRRTPANNPEICAEKEQAQQAACMNTLLTAWTADVGFVLDRLERLNTSEVSSKFTGRLDMTRIGVFGHSFGGATAAQFCHNDSRCKAGIDIDGQPFGSVVSEGLRQPFMFLLSDHGNSRDPVSQTIKSNIQSIYDRLPADGRQRIAIRGANHFTFSDDGALLKSRVVRGALRLFGGLRMDGDRQLAVTAYCIHSFFDAYLKRASPSRLQISSPLYPEIQVLE